MLTLFRRHTPACVHRRKQHDRDWRRCNCVISVSGTLAREKVRQSLHTRNWNEAAKLVMEAEVRGHWQVSSNQNSKTIAETLAAFLADAESEKGRALRDSTLSKYRTLEHRLLTFCGERKITLVSELTAEHIRDFRDTWPTSARSTSNYLNSLKCWLKWCVENEWIDKNPALAVKPPKQHDKVDTQKIPYTEDEVERLVSAAASDFALQTLILLLRTTGMRISDAVFLSTEQVPDGQLKVKTRKTGSKIAMPLRPDVWERLQQLPLRREKYYFLGDSDRLSTATDFWRRKFKDVAKRADVAKPSLHRLRHSAAVGWLLAGLPTETVAALLGHSSPAITSRFYSCWVDSRQKALDEEVKRLWEKENAA